MGSRWDEATYHHLSWAESLLPLCRWSLANELDRPSDAGFALTRAGTLGATHT